MKYTILTITQAVLFLIPAAWLINSYYSCTENLLFTTTSQLPGDYMENCVKYPLMSLFAVLAIIVVLGFSKRKLNHE